LQSVALEPRVCTQVHTAQPAIDTAERDAVGPAIEDGVSVHGGRWSSS
jgi:hypothetical protein